MFWHTNIDIIGLFFQFVYREVAEILEDRDIQIEEYVFGTFSNYLDTKYICNEDYKEEFFEIIEKEHNIYKNENYKFKTLFEMVETLL